MTTHTLPNIKHTPSVQTIGSTSADLGFVWEVVEAATGKVVKASLDADRRAAEHNAWLRNSVG